MANTEEKSGAASTNRPASERLAGAKVSAKVAKQVRLRLVYVDFWSITKLAFLTSVALAIVTFVAVVAIWFVLDQTGIFEKLGEFLVLMIGEAQFAPFAAIGLGEVLGVVGIVVILNIVVGTALGAITAILYNLAAKITGGVLLGFSNN